MKGLMVLPPIDPQTSSPKKGPRLSRSQIRILRRGLDSDGFRNAIKSRKDSTSKLRGAVAESRAQESLGGKRNRKTAKRRRAKKSCGFFW
jgi:hypothetical protein